MKLTPVFCTWTLIASWTVGSTGCVETPLPEGSGDAGIALEAGTTPDAGVPEDVPAVADAPEDEALAATPDAGVPEDIPAPAVADAAEDVAPSAAAEVFPADLRSGVDALASDALSPVDRPSCPIYTGDCKGPRCAILFDWATTLLPESWWHFLMYFPSPSMTLCHTGLGYDQSIASSQAGVVVDLYDSATGKFVQRLATRDLAVAPLACTDRAADAPEDAIALAPLPCETIVELGSKQDAGP